MSHEHDVSNHRQLDRLLNSLCGLIHYKDVIMSTMASQITGVSSVYSTVYFGADHRKHQSSASLAFVRGIHRWPVNSLHKGPVTQTCFHMMTSPWAREISKLHSKSITIKSSCDGNPPVIPPLTGEFPPHSFHNRNRSLVGNDVRSKAHTSVVGAKEPK